MRPRHILSIALLYALSTRDKPFSNTGAKAAPKNPKIREVNHLTSAHPTASKGQRKRNKRDRWS